MVITNFDNSSDICISYRFIQVETGFFWKWWRNQNSYIQGIVKNLVDEGRLEFVGGGWSMNDEATTHYSAIIDNMSFGFKTLLDTFGMHFLRLLTNYWPELL